MDEYGELVGGTRQLFATNPGIREYALQRGQNTEALLQGVIIMASDEIQKMRKDEDAQLSAEDLALKYGSQAVAKITKEHMSSGLSIPRIFLGGKYLLEDVIKAAGCVDAAVFSQAVLDEGFGIKSVIKTKRIGVVPNHYYLLVEDGSVIDPVAGSGGNRQGYFNNEETHARVVNAINSLGLSEIGRQITNLIKGR